ncbi:hypothetical protein PPL_11910 [Heterostelium album PN500]|uniref:Uncharacterized protein n=1 Tax=Heterostelium pallidum (strain ATCC 26659 / Pp 5 / PN500) TaxID=670386 RepID=D3BUT8_HETP5|nr:hypothetical protein PPL_11910 [Heterostelium album PN500]EFA74876.1 hypothetical protein PPL_11910 [Heterostelium album PN500]|eukprot:XP_020427010.1 hypothetical protein PPL_11910 [Heterostelium album PN500]
MVYGLLIHSLPSTTTTTVSGSGGSSDFVVYCSQFYTSDGNDEMMQRRQTAVVQRVLSEHQFKYQCDNTKPDERAYPDWAVAFLQRQREQQQVAAALSSGSAPPVTSGTGASGSSGMSSRNSDNGPRDGIFRIVPPKLQTTPVISPANDSISSASQYFSTSKYVIWKQMLGVCFTVICEPDENRLLVINFLNMFNNILLDFFKNVISKSSIQEVSIMLYYYIKSEDILLLLHHYLPNGQLLFSSNQYVKHTKSIIASSNS